MSCFLAILTVPVLAVGPGVWSGLEVQELLESLKESRDIMSNKQNAASKPANAAEETARISVGEEVPGEPKAPNQTEPSGK